MPSTANATAISVTLVELPREQQHGGEHDDVERYEQLRARAADVHADPNRDAGEREHGQQPRDGAQDTGEPDADSERCEDAAEDQQRSVRDDRDPEDDGAESREREAGDALGSSTRDEEEREAEAGDGTADLREPAHRTSTVARAT
jgi:hypothetical protein